MSDEEGFHIDDDDSGAYRRERSRLSRAWNEGTIDCSTFVREMRAVARREFPEPIDRLLTYDYLVEDADFVLTWHCLHDHIFASECVALVRHLYDAGLLPELDPGLRTFYFLYPLMTNQTDSGLLRFLHEVGYIDARPIYYGGNIFATSEAITPETLRFLLDLGWRSKSLFDLRWDTPAKYRAECIDIILEYGLGESLDACYWPRSMNTDLWRVLEKHHARDDLSRFIQRNLHDMSFNPLDAHQLQKHFFTNYNMCYSMSQMLFVLERETDLSPHFSHDGILDAAGLAAIGVYWRRSRYCQNFLREFGLFLCYNPVACPVQPGSDLCMLDPYLTWDPPRDVLRCRRYYSKATRARLMTLLLVARRHWGTSAYLRPMIPAILRHLMTMQFHEQWARANGPLLEEGPPPATAAAARSWCALQ